ncbi:MAG: DUF1697 domain-containing protein [Actinobacteria bacterium]|nr:DUF1697 domain-containing protein [Actinomycetota bacterium]
MTGAHTVPTEPPATTQVALLRGINTGRSQRMTMGQLREVFAAVGLPAARTFLQSGNVLFGAAPAEVDPLRERLERAITERLGLTVAVVVRSAGALAETVARSPLAGREADPQRYLVAFCSHAPEPDRVRAVTPEGFLGVEYAVRGREIYLWCPAGVRMTALTQDLWEKRLQLTATTRNWNTVRRLAALAAAHL